MHQDDLRIMLRRSTLSTVPGANAAALAHTRPGFAKDTINH